MRKLIVTAGAIAVLLSGPVVQAHHPFAADYDENREVTLKGKVVQFMWANPHASIDLEGQTSSGEKGQWSVELGSVADLTRSGWKKESVKVGDQILIEGWLAKADKMHANAKLVRTADGTTLSAASSFYADDHHDGH
jgi:uncharacterized protein DUF6152